MESLRFHIQTFGCQMNDHDSEVLAHLLESEGYLQAADATDADVVLVNTCAIREKAEQKLYSQLGRYRVLKKNKPDLVLGVGGCVAQEEGRKIFRRVPFVDLVFGTQTTHTVPGLIEKVLRDRRQVVATAMDDVPETMEALYAHARGRSPRAFVTVMQGCDNYCAYCIVPHVRGRERSRAAHDIVAEVERLVADGVVEITLLGQNVNSYGTKPRGDLDFPGLLRRVAAVPGLGRLRFTTSHPKDLSEALIRSFSEVPNLMPHIHLALQSGSDRVLEAMNRRYTSGHFVALADALRSVRPDIAITSDMIVGFPGETDRDFEATLAVMDRVRFDGLFSFKYSPRPGTRAATLTDPVPVPVQEARLAILQARQDAHTLERNRVLEGVVRPALVEGPSRSGQGKVVGRIPENKVVNFPGDPEWVGREVPVRITAAAVHSLKGVVADAAVDAA